MATAKRDQTVSFRTTPEANRRIEKLAEKLDEHKWDFDWNSVFRKANTKSGLLDQLCKGNISIRMIEEKLANLEKNEEE